jgi:hypothetical protein
MATSIVLLETSVTALQCAGDIYCSTNLRGVDCCAGDLMSVRVRPIMLATCAGSRVTQGIFWRVQGGSPEGMIGPCPLQMALVLAT